MGRVKRASNRRAGTPSREWLTALALFAIAVGLRLAFLSRFPTLPISDFRGLIGFGRHFLENGLAAPGWWWTQFNAGLPLLLSLLFRIFPTEGPEVARLATAAWTGTLPLFPFLLWRGALPYGARLAAGLLLALWPGQVFFSGVVAQDNWVLVPAVALGGLAARRLLRPEEGTHPIAAGLLYAGSVAIRQEMLIVLAPLVLAASVSRRGRDRARSAVLLALAAGIPLFLLASQRALATQRFALTTEHTGLAFLGSFVPGASAAGWIQPAPYVASVEPEALESPEKFRASATRLAWREAMRRPGFHALRVTSEGLRLLYQSDAENLYWSVSRDVLPPAQLEAGGRFTQRFRPLLLFELAVLQGLFAASLLVGLRRRNPAILALGASVLLKVGLHAVASPMSRLVLPATALAMLTIPIASSEISRLGPGARRAAVAVALAVPTLLFLLVPLLRAAVVSSDRDIPRTYRFPIAVSGVRRPVLCRMDRGRLRTLDWERATIEPFEADPRPGDRARVTCVVPPLRSGERLVLRFEDAYAAGGLPGRMVERVEVDGREVLSHDLAAEPFAGWLEVPVSDASDAPGRAMTFEIVAVAPDPGWKWGRAAGASFEFARRPVP
jgi:hypothetical protein